MFYYISGISILFVYYLLPHIQSGYRFVCDKYEQGRKFNTYFNQINFVVITSYLVILVVFCSKQFLIVMMKSFILSSQEAIS